MRCTNDEFQSLDQIKDSKGRAGAGGGDMVAVAEGVSGRHDGSHNVTRPTRAVLDTRRASATELAG
jgi:hypothetical protein